MALLKGLGTSGNFFCCRGEFDIRVVKKTATNFFLQLNFYLDSCVLKMCVFVQAVKCYSKCVCESKYKEVD